MAAGGQVCPITCAAGEFAAAAAPAAARGPAHQVRARRRLRRWGMCRRIVNNIIRIIIYKMCREQNNLYKCAESVDI